jgi:hypothetical protein
MRMDAMADERSRRHPKAGDGHKRPMDRLKAELRTQLDVLGQKEIPDKLRDLLEQLQRRLRETRGDGKSED